MRKPSRQREEQLGKPGRVDPWPEGLPPLEEVAEKAYFRGSGKHKTYPAPNNEWIPTMRGKVARCDKYPKDQWIELTKVLRDAIRVGCVQLDTQSEFPSRVWCFVNGVLHEGRLTNPETGEYHGLPLRQSASWPIDRLGKLKDAPRVDIATD